MTTENSLTPDQLTRSLAALSKHLQRIGAAHLPQGDAAAGEQWISERVAEGIVALAAPEEPAVAAPTAAPVVPSASTTRSVPRAATTRRDPSPSGRSSGQPLTPYPASLPLPARKQQLETFAVQVAGCTRCPELVCSRTQTVFGEGNPQARVCFFGEAPGADEDRQGRPFVGRAGQLLTKMIEACTLRREDVYILNTLKCRPPDNRNPLPEELDHCREYFEAQFDLIQPEYIVCLGLFAAQTLLQSKLSVGRLRGRFHAYRTSKVLVTYHPSYLLRTDSAKKLAWEDLKIMLADMGIQR